jgi:hypothetical protein
MINFFLVDQEAKIHPKKTKNKNKKTGGADQQCCSHMSSMNKNLLK